MRQFFLFAIVLSFLFSPVLANPHNTDPDQSLSKVDRIYYTCKIWGFLKYYHPLVSKGSFDWDDKIASVLKNTANIQTYPEFSEFMSRWIYYMGQVPPCTTCRQSGSGEAFLKNFDLSWTQDSRFSDELKKSLKNIELNRFQGNHYYAGQGDLQLFEPRNEQPHDDLNLIDEYERLIPLFRYWNYIEYFYPYKYQTDQDWDEVLKEMIPKFLAAEKKLDFHLAILELIVKVDDTHAGLSTPVLDEMPYSNYLPARFDYIENQAVITEIIDPERAKLNDLQIGDAIKTVNGQSVSDLHKANKKYIWGSNDAVKNRSIYHTLFMGLKESPRVTIERNGATRTENLLLYKYSDISYTKSPPKPKWESIGDSIGYVNLDALLVRDVDQMMGEFMDKTVIILDVRNEPKGTYRAISKYLNTSDTTFAIYTKPDFSYPGKFVWQGKNKCGEKNEDYYKGKVILLVNEKTQDHAEFTCMCLQTAPNVTVIGSQTAGTDGKAINFPIYSRFYTSMTGMGVFYANKEPTQRVGIAQDVYVTPTIAGIRAGRDEILETAIEVAKEEIARVLAEAARLEAARLDSIRQDSIRRYMRMDSIQMDTLQINKDGKQ
ncbi:S41 family peptidase [Ekhidna sp.]|uniref:S41 family peptidase n=1 Tax=Ekhidna sp. TaxID=2608089 RepID=UPI0032EF93C4